MKIGICGLGAIGMKVAEVLDQGGLPGMTLAAVSATDAGTTKQTECSLDACEIRMTEMSASRSAWKMTIWSPP